MVWEHVEKFRGELCPGTEATDFLISVECAASRVHVKCDGGQGHVRRVRGKAGAAVDHQEALPCHRGGP